MEQMCSLDMCPRQIPVQFDIKFENFTKGRADDILVSHVKLWNPFKSIMYVHITLKIIRTSF